MSGSAGQPDSIEERLQSYHKVDQARDKWIRDLLRENQSLKKKVKTSESLELQIENLTKSLKTKSEGYEGQSRRLQEAEEDAAANPFAVVLLDGDGYIFPDGLLSQGESTGIILSSGTGCGPERRQCPLVTPNASWFEPQETMLIPHITQELKAAKRLHNVYSTRRANTWSNIKAPKSGR